jgi:HEAT repeat protein
VIRKSAIQYFGKIESEKNFQRLIELAEYGGTSWTARSTAVNELGKYVKAHPELLEKFVKWLDDPDYYVRIKAAQLLGKYGSEKHKDALDQLAYRYPASEKSVRFAKNAIDRKLTKPKSKFEIENEKLRTQLEEIQSVLKK